MDINFYLLKAFTVLIMKILNLSCFRKKNMKKKSKVVNLCLSKNLITY